MIHRTLNPKISVIVPIYNVEKYLYRCLSSIVKQSLKEIEIILVDDGSTDGSGRVCDKFAAVDSRIRVIHKNNQGLSCARNDGIDISTAPYLMFVDGDDWVETNFCSVPYMKAVERNIDIVLFGYRRVRRDGITEKMIWIPSGNISRLDALRYNIDYSPMVWTGLYRRELFEKVRFPEGKIFEDVGITHRLIYIAQNIYLINEYLYNHRMGRPGSISTLHQNKVHPDRLEMFKRKARDLKKWGYDGLYKKDAFEMMVHYNLTSNDQALFIGIVNSKGRIIPGGFSWKQKIMLMVYRVSPCFFAFLCNITGKRRR